MGVVVGILGFGGGVVSGLLGLSGAVLMIPLLLYVPPLLGVGELDVKTVAAVAIVQGVFASSSAIIAHGRAGNIYPRIALMGGVFVFTGALIGGVLSKWTPEVTLLAVFAVVVTLAVVLMAIPGGSAPRSEIGFKFRRPWRLGIFFPEGLMAGMVGLGGGIITTPILHRIMGVPIRIAMGSTLVMTWLGVIAGFIGKAATGQVPLWLSVVAVMGAVPGAQLGALANRRIPRVYLRYLFVALLLVVTVSMWLRVLTRMGVF